MDTVTTYRREIDTFPSESSIALLQSDLETLCKSSLASKLCTRAEITTEYRGEHPILVVYHDNPRFDALIDMYREARNPDILSEITGITPLKEQYVLSERFAIAISELDSAIVYNSHLGRLLCKSKNREQLTKDVLTVSRLLENSVQELVVDVQYKFQEDVFDDLLTKFGQKLPISCPLVSILPSPTKGTLSVRYKSSSEEDVLALSEQYAPHIKRVHFPSKLKAEEVCKKLNEKYSHALVVFFYDDRAGTAEGQVVVFGFGESLVSNLAHAIADTNLSELNVELLESYSFTESLDGMSYVCTRNLEELSEIESKYDIQFDRVSECSLAFKCHPLASKEVFRRLELVFSRIEKEHVPFSTPFTRSLFKLVYDVVSEQICSFAGSMGIWTIDESDFLTAPGALYLESILKLRPREDLSAAQRPGFYLCSDDREKLGKLVHSIREKLKVTIVDITPHELVPAVVLSEFCSRHDIWGELNYHEPGKIRIYAQPESRHKAGWVSNIRVISLFDHKLAYVLCRYWVHQTHPTLVSGGMVMFFDEYSCIVVSGTSAEESELMNAKLWDLVLKLELGEIPTVSTEISGLSPQKFVTLMTSGRSDSSTNPMPEFIQKLEYSDSLSVTVGPSVNGFKVGASTIYVVQGDLVLSSNDPVMPCYACHYSPGDYQLLDRLSACIGDPNSWNPIKTSTNITTLPSGNLFTRGVVQIIAFPLGGTSSLSPQVFETQLQHSLSLLLSQCYKIGINGLALSYVSHADPKNRRVFSKVLVRMVSRCSYPLSVRVHTLDPIDTHFMVAACAKVSNSELTYRMVIRGVGYLGQQRDLSRYCHTFEKNIARDLSRLWVSYSCTLEKARSLSTRYAIEMTNHGPGIAIIEGHPKCLALAQSSGEFVAMFMSITDLHGRKTL